MLTLVGSVRRPTFLINALERFRGSCHEWMRAIPTQLFIQGLQTLNQVCQMLSGIHATRSLAKVGATTKGPV
jgi:hypothetical protein